MPDIVDIANEYIELEHEERLRKARTKARFLEAEFKGECLYCGDTLPKARRWCDAEHRDLWQKAQNK